MHVSINMVTVHVTLCVLVTLVVREREYEDMAHLMYCSILLHCTVPNTGLYCCVKA